MSAFEPDTVAPAPDPLRAFWIAASETTRQEIIADLYAPVCRAGASLSVAARRRAIADWRLTFAAASPAARRRWHSDLAASLPGFESRHRSQMRTDPADIGDIADFLKAQTVKRFHVHTEAQELYRAFLTWARANGRASVTIRVFALRLKTLGLVAIKVSRMRWRDLELIVDAQTEAGGDTTRGRG